jgi:hypothetical protein
LVAVVLVVSGAGLGVVDLSVAGSVSDFTVRRWFEQGVFKLWWYRSWVFVFWVDICNQHPVYRSRDLSWPARRVGWIDRRAFGNYVP